MSPWGWFILAVFLIVSGVAVYYSIKHFQLMLGG